ncbi:MAG: hypothetical protein BGO98_19625 [Myxococcales bacterium 68-20]|nr:NAD-dependent epimerase/dehydratase family protein [Myxococcales bacterium]OJY22499.1 MAG: hypothetical protein BGO98_19625 [Myxococcales bacterium 68-20]
MKVFVTGGNGFIGSCVVRTLVREGHEVRCLLRKSSNIDRLAGYRYERALGDVRDPMSIAAGMDGCEAVIHLASLSAWDQIDSPLMDEVVLGGTRNVLAAASARPGTRVVFVSSTLAINASDRPVTFDESSAFTAPLDGLTYSRSKLEAEALCLRAANDGVHVTIVNPGEVYGPEDTSLITSCNLIDFATSSPVLVCDGGMSVAFIDDVANGVVQAMLKGRSGERYILSGDNLSVYELASLTLKLLGKRTRVIKIPNGLIRPLAKAGLKFRLPLPFNPRVIPYATKYWFTSSWKAGSELGVKFRPARDALLPTLDWLIESGRIPS